MLSIPNLKDERCPGHKQPWECVVCLRNEMRVLMAANQTLRTLAGAWKQLFSTAFGFLHEDTPPQICPRRADREAVRDGTKVLRMASDLSCDCAECKWWSRVTPFVEEARRELLLLP